ncbi:MAG TPA: hypothetical protein VG860_21710 [Terriglobia bacterium]|nr:hypothetical protein [Terriglobia bacterium]
MDETTLRRLKSQQRNIAEYEALADFANLGDTPDDWRAFREKWPGFFSKTSGFEHPGPENLTEWLYLQAEEWAKWGVASPRRLETTLPALLWYRDHLRAVWTGNDPNGVSLSMALGFGAEAMSIAAKVGSPVTKTLASSNFFVVPEGSFNPEKLGTVGGLPMGRPVVNGIAGTISWEFGCAFQRGVYDLMRDRWRAMVCPQCKRFFIAGRTAQNYCSPQCSTLKKQEQALDYYYRKARGQKKAVPRPSGSQRRKTK